MKNEKTVIPFALIIAILATSTSSVFIRYAQKDAPSLVIAALRLSIAALALAPIALTRHRAVYKNLSSREWILAILSGAFLAIHFATWITSLEYTTVVSSVVFVSTGPLWVALLSPLFLKEIPTRWVWIGMSLALLGGITVGLSDSCTSNGFSLSCPPLSQLMAGSAFYGNFLALIGAFAVAGYLMIGRTLRAKLDLIPYIFLVYSSAAITLIITMFAANESPFGYSSSTYIYIIALAIIPQLIGHSTFNWALRHIPASLVSITTLAEPVASAFLAFFLLQENPSIFTLIGGLLILAGIYISSK